MVPECRPTDRPSAIKCCGHSCTQPLALRPRFSPASTRSRMRSRQTPRSLRVCASGFPGRVVASMLSARLTNATPSACSSSSRVIRVGWCRVGVLGVPLGPPDCRDADGPFPRSRASGTLTTSFTQRTCEPLTVRCGLERGQERGDSNETAGSHGSARAQAGTRLPAGRDPVLPYRRYASRV